MGQDNNIDLNIEFRASSAYRWFNCYKSLELTAMLPEGKSSVFAAEGTVAHRIAQNIIEDIKLSVGNDAQSVINKTKMDFKLGKKNVIIREDEFDIKVNDEMLNAVEQYIMYIDKFLSIHSLTWKDVVVEEKTNILKRKNFSGTLDAYFITDSPFGKEAHIFDLKYGKGKYVTTKDNPQLQIYSVILDGKEELEDTYVHIVQPRITGVNTCRYEKYTKEEVLNFKKFLQKKLKDIKDNPDRMKQGDWCSWCPAKPSCPLLKQVMESPDLFSIDENTTPEQYAILWEKVDGIEKQIKTIKEKVMEYALNGGEVKGYQLAPGKMTRKWIDAAKVEREFLSKYGGVKIYEPVTLKSPAQMEKSIGKEAIEEYVTSVATTQILKKKNSDSLELESILKPIN